MNFTVRVLLVSFIFLFSCEDEEVNRPVFRTLEVSELTTEGATYNGKVSVLGDAPINKFGFVWDTQANPDITDSVYYFSEKPNASQFSIRITDDLIGGAEYFVRTFLKTSNKVYYGNTVKFKSLGSATPVVSDFTPKSGAALEMITITGDHFSDNKDNNNVVIGATICKVISASRTELVVQIPPAFITGNYPIQVTVAGKTATSKTNFSLEGPIVQNISPASGTGGISMTITGSGFSSTLELNKVYFDEYAAVVTGASPTQLQVTVPFINYAGAKQVSVVVNNATGLSADPFNLTGPTITSFSPSSGVQGSQVTINGSGFSSIPSENYITFGYGVGTIQIISATPEQLIVQVPIVSQAAQVNIGVTVKTVTGYSEDLFEIEGPEITSITPSSQYGGRAVTLLGKNFDPTGSLVGFQNYPGSIVEATETSITVLVPFELTMPGPVSVQVGGIRFTTPFDFSVLSPWQKLANFPGGKRYGAISFTVGAYAYVGMGIGGNKSLWRFNPLNNSWLRMADYPGPSRAYSFSFTINGKAYVGGGGVYGASSYDLITKLYDLWEYDPSTDTWTQKQGFSPNGLSNLNMDATAIGGYGYFTANNLLYRYDPAVNQWSTSASYPYAHSPGSVAMTAGGKGYFGLGIVSTTFWEYSPDTGIWTQMPDGPNFGYWDPTYFVVNNKLYIGTHFLFFEFDTVAKQWKQLPVMPVSFGSTAAFGINNSGYFVTGVDGDAKDQFYSFNPNY